MAKYKKNDAEDTEVAVLDSTTKTVDWKELALFNENKANEALERNKQYEELLAALMPDLRVCSRYLNNLQVHAGVRVEEFYRKVRDLLAERQFIA